MTARIWPTVVGERTNGRREGGRSLSSNLQQNPTKMTRAGLEPATHGLKERPEFIPRERPSTPKFVPLLTLMRGGVRSPFSEFLRVTRRFRDKWGATRVQPIQPDRALTQERGINGGAFVPTLIRIRIYATLCHGCDSSSLGSKPFQAILLSTRERGMIVGMPHTPFDCVKETRLVAHA
jgi:hypothetical protein